MDSAWWEEVESLLQFISACRSGDWEGYLAALENNIKYFFARDLFNYARLMPLYLAEMNDLEHGDPVTWAALKSDDVVVPKSEIPFTKLFVDQKLDKKNYRYEGTLSHHTSVIWCDSS